MKKALYIFFFINFFAHSMQQQKTLTVITSDNKTVKVPEKYLLLCGVLKKLVNDCSDVNNPIPLPNISSSDLNLLLPLLKSSSTLQDYSAQKIAKQVAEAEFNKLTTQQKLHTVLCAANYLHEPYLLQRCAQMWAQRKYSPTQDTPLPWELNMKIASLMSTAQKLIDDTALWVARDLKKSQDSLLVKTYDAQASSVWVSDISNNGQFLVGGHGTGIISFFNLQTDEGKILDSGHQQVSSLKYTPDGLHVWSSGEDGSIKLWDVATYSLVETLESDASKGFIFSHIPQHSFLIADGVDNELCVWDLQNKKNKPHILAAHNDSILSIQSSKDGSLFASGGHDGTVYLWDTKTLQARVGFLNNSSVMSSCFNNNNTRLVYGLNDGTLKIYDLPTAKKIDEKKEHDRGIWSVAYADEELMCSGSKDTFIKLWDMRMRNPIVTLYDHRREIQHIAVNQEQGIFSSACHDETMKLWDIRKLSEPIKKLRAEFSRDTTIDQVLLLEQANKNKTPLDLSVGNRKHYFDHFSPEAQKLLLGHMNITEHK